MNILVTGGTGYIGAHTALTLLENGHDVVIADNLSNSSIDVLDKLKILSGRDIVFYQADMTDKEATDKIFKENKIDGIIHFAGYKAVGESVSQPLKYYYNNLVSTIILADLCLKYGVSKFIFSSSATVYGDNKSPMLETMDLLPTTNPYGETKGMCERILMDTARVNQGFDVTLLRYFNPVGAHPSGLIGERPKGVPNNLMPYLSQVASGKREKLMVFGDDYDTVDGTGVRDYIHVLDLAEGHLAALERQTAGVSVYNLGTGRGTSVLELIRAFEEANGIKVPFEIVARRPGDIAVCFADACKAERELGWRAKRGIEEMVRDSWNFEKRNF